jgi:NADPH:quinone reductase-like Zn-dependent oxidoreductase
MNSIQAVVVDPTVTERLTLANVSTPTPLPSQALVRVAVISLNRGEVRRSQSAEAGWRPGWDLAGTIETAAADGSGFPTGTRVVGMLPLGAWAELVAVPTHSLAALPDSVSFEQAATLPVAGLTALHCLAKGGNLLGKSVLITGASGGVGYFAVQLARLAGARVTAQLRRSDLTEFVRQAGAQQVVIGDDLQNEESPYDLILDSIGGKTLASAISSLARGGTCVIYGSSAEPTVTFNVPQLYGKGGASLYGLILFYELESESASVGLKRLVRLVAEGQLSAHIDLTASWTEIGSVARQLMERKFIGKAVLHLSN